LGGLDLRYRAGVGRSPSSRRLCDRAGRNPGIEQANRAVCAEGARGNRPRTDFRQIIHVATGQASEGTLNQRKTAAGFCFAMLVLILGGCANHYVAITDIHNQAVPAQAQRLSPDEVTQRISAAAAHLGWQVAQEASIGPGELGRLRAIYTKKDHVVTVRISFNQAAYNLEFVSSSNMDQDSGKISHKYAEWLGNLNSEISRELGRAS